MSGYLINFCGVVHMPRLGPSCLVLFLPRMLLLHPYIHLAGNVARNEGYEPRRKPGWKRDCLR